MMRLLLPAVAGSLLVSGLVARSFSNGASDRGIELNDRVAGGNEPPVIVDAGGTSIDTLVVTTAEDVLIQICLNAIDPEGLPLDATGISVIDLNGTISGLADGDTCITYTPFPDYNGSDSLYVFVCDGFNACDSVLLIIQVTPLNDAPVIVDGGFVSLDTLNTSTPANTPLTICLNAIDYDDDSLDVTAILNGPLNGIADSFNDGDTCFTYTPAPGFTGMDTLTAVVCDNSGACDTVLVIIEVTGANNAPIIVDGNFTPTDTLTYSTPEDAPIIICITAIDFDGDTLDITDIFGGPLNGNASGIADGDTCFTYTPDPGWNGTDMLTAVVCDGNGGCDTVVVIIDVTPVNDPPVIVQGGNPVDTLNYTTPEDVPIIICITAIDFDGDTLGVTETFGGPSNGNTSGIIDGDTCFTYTPDPDWNGTDTLTAAVCDGNGGCDTVLVIIDVTPVNDPPVIVQGGNPVDTLNYTTPEDAAITICITAIDLDGDTLDITGIFGGPLNGSTSGIADGDTCFTYTPDSDWNGTDTLTAVVCDGNGGCDTVLVIIDVNPVNDPPVIVQGGDPVDTLNYTTPEDAAITICITAIDFDGDTLDVTEIFGGPVNGNASGVADGDTCFTYTPDPGWNGTDTLTAVVCDGNGACDTVLVIIEVTPVNDPPVAVDDAAGTDVNTSIVVSVLNNDSDPNGDAIIVSSATAANGFVAINGDGSLTYTPPTGFCGTDTIFYTICDPEPLCDQGIVVVTVECPPPNDPPIAVDDSTIVDLSSDMLVPILVLDNDSDPNGDPLIVTSADASNGAVTIGNNGELYYTPDVGFCGIDTITYTICDPGPLCDEGLVFVTVLCPETLAVLLIPQGFSPNGDGYGDTWTIAGLEVYPQARVTIFNRWGHEVYNADPYGNRWDGRSTNALTWDGALPVGTYWYLLDLGVEGEEVRTGYIYLNR